MQSIQSVLFLIYVIYSLPQVLHFLTAIVSMRVSLLRDEQREEEEAGASSRMTTVATKDYTSPIRYAATSKEGSPHLNTKADPGEVIQADVKASLSWDAYPDDWVTDEVVGVSVRDRSGRYDHTWDGRLY